MNSGSPPVTVKISVHDVYHSTKQVLKDFPPKLLTFIRSFLRNIKQILSFPTNKVRVHTSSTKGNNVS